VESLMKVNQMHKGKTAAFAQFRDVLARELVGAVPELEADVGVVVARSS
jgi:mediator of RNA polymerase II transcription subunit 10